MNAKRFKVIFSKRRNALIVVGENASSVTKAQGTSEASNPSKDALQSFVGALSSIFLAVNCAYAAPTGGEFAAGAGAIATAGALTSIHQTTQQAIVNWQSFSSASHETIQFVQPNANAAILNRVVGNLPSQLNGTLIGNGHVYLINQNGIMLGKDGIINVHGSFVGSTRDVNNEAFMQGGALVFKGESVGDIQILGKVKSEQGDILLIASKVDIKEGAELVAGEKVQLVAANEVQLSNGKITVKPSTTDAGQISVEGAIQAAQVQLLANNNNLGALAINTTGTIRATGTQTNPDGSVSLMAEGEGSNIKVSGTIEASNFDNAKQGGSIIIGRNIDTGHLAQSTDASGAVLKTNKGFVETSGDYLKVDGIQVKASEWLLDPNDIVIGSAATSGTGIANAQTLNGVSQINATDLGNALTTGTSVTVQTSSTATGGNGDITVSTAVTAAGDGTLKLLAGRNLAINANINTKGGDAQLQTVGGQITLATNVSVTGNNISLDTTNGTIGTGGAIAAGAAVTSANAITLNTGSKLLATNNLNMRANAGGANNTLTLNGTLQAKTITGDFTSNSGNSINMSGATITTLAGGGSSKLSGIHTSTAGNGAFVSGLNSITAATGTDFTLTSNSTAVASAVYSASRGLRIENGSITTNGMVTIEGKSSNSDGILMITNGGLKNTGGTLTVTGSSTGSGGGGVNGINFQGGAFIQGTTNTANLKITGFTANSSASGAETGAAFTGGGGIVGVGGTLDLTGYSSSGSNSSGLTVGTTISGWGTTNIVGQNLRASSGDAININAAVSSTGNMTIQSIGGRVNQVGGSLSAARLTIDNTGAGLSSYFADAGAGLSAAASMGGAIDATTGIVTSKGTGKSNAGQHGLNLQAAISTSGALYLSGETVAALGSGVRGISVNASVGATGGATIDAISDVVIEGSGTLSGGTGNVGGLTKAGSGKLTLSTANVMKGVTLVSAGTLELNNVNALQMSTLDTGTSGAQQVTFALAGANTYNIGALQGADNLAIVSNTISVGGNNTNKTYDGVISGTGNLTKAGTGTQTLTGANTYTGSTTINAGGSLQLGSGVGGGTSGSIATSSAITDNGTLIINRSDAFALNQTITGSGELQKSAAGTATLSGATTYTGASTVLAGTLQFTNGSKSSAYAISSGATAEFNVASGTTLDLPTSTITGAGTLKKTGNGTVAWAGGAGTFNMSAGGLIDVQQGTFVGGSSANEVWTNNKSSLNVNTNAVFQGVEANVVVDALTGSGSVQVGWSGAPTGGSISTGVNGTLAGLYNSAGSALFSGIISNYAGQTAGGFIKTGAGTQILTGNNSYSGKTSVTDGILQIGDAGTTGTTGTLGAGAVTLSGGANLNFNRSDAFTVANNISGAGTVSQNGSGVGSTSNVTLTGDLSAETGAFNVNRGTMTLSAAGTNRKFNGSAININNGSTVKITSTTGNNYAFGTTWNFDANGGGTIDASPTVNFAMGYFTTSPNNTFNTNGGATNNIIGAYTGGINTNTASSTTTFNVANGSSSVGLNVSADLWNSGSIVKTGAGLMQLSNVTPDATTGFSGAIAVNQGTLQVGNGGTSGYLGSGKVTLSNNANLNYLRSAATTINNEIVGTGNVNATITGAGALTVSKTINLINGNINLMASGTLTVNQDIITKTTGDVSLTGGNVSSSGIGVNVNGNVASVGNINIEGQSTNTFAVIVQNGKSVKTTNSLSNPKAVEIKGTSAGKDVRAVVITGSVETINGSTLRIEGTSTNGGDGIYTEVANGQFMGSLGSITSGAITLIGTSTGGTDNALNTDASLNQGYGVQLRGNVTSQQKISITGTADNQPGVFLQQSSFDYGRDMSAPQPEIKVFAGANMTGDAIYIKGTNLKEGTNNKNGVLIGSKITNESNGGATTIESDKGGVALLTSSTTKNGVTTTGSGSITNGNGAGAINITAGTDASSTASIGEVLANIGTGSNVSSPWTFTAAGTNITQNSNAGVNLKTTGQGNIVVPKITNQGTGDVVIAAGSQIAASTGTGGQVKTISGNTITQGNVGKTYIYTGNANDTGLLSNIDLSFADLNLSAIGSNGQNADSNVAYNANSLGISGANMTAQVMFREKVALGGALNNATVTYGDSTSSAAVKTALQAANLATGNLTVISTASNAGTFKILSADVIADMATGKPSVDTVLNVPTNKSTSGNLKASSAGYAIDIAGTNYNLTGITAKLMVDPREALVLADGKTVVFNNTQQTDSVTKRGFINGDNIVINGMGSGVQAGSYLSNLQVSGSDSSNYNVTYKNTVFNISAQTYVRPPNEATILSPVSFGLAFVGAASAAGGDGVDVSAACDAWSQRVGVGSLSVMTLLKPNAMGLRNAKTDTMDAMTGVQGAFAQAELGDSPCGSASLVAKQAGL